MAVLAPNANIDLPVAVLEVGGHVAQDVGAEGLAGLHQAQAGDFELVAVEPDLHFGIAVLHVGGHVL